MAGLVRVEMNSAGVQAILKSDGVMADLKRRADRMAAAAGEGMESSVQVGATRARASVITGTREAREAEATRRALTGSIDAGRG